MTLRRRLGRCLAAAVLSLLALLPAGCEEEALLGDFRSDGCSLFPDRSVLTRQDWCECCFEHDLAYWRGGTEEERLLADLELRRCVLEKTGDERLADLMFEGVRLGGSPYFYNWYRWGYGWPYDRKYGPLTDEEQAQVERKLQEYYDSHPVSPCGGEAVEPSVD